MSTDTIPIQRMYYGGYILEVTAVTIDGRWYPLLHILTQTFLQTHPWQLPAIDGAKLSSTAIRTGISLGYEMIRADAAQAGGSIVEQLALNALKKAIR